MKYEAMHNRMRQITKEEAIFIHEKRLWEDWSYGQRAKFQLYQERLAMPFDVFHEAITKMLKRDVYTHEFAMNRQGLIDEVNGIAGAPTFDEIVAMIPPEKKVIVIE